MTRKPSKQPSTEPAQTPPAVPRRTPSQAQQARIETVAAKSAARADGPPMKLKVVDGVLQIIFTHADTDLAHILMMADLGTCDPSFMAGVQSQIAGIGAHGRRIDEGASNFLLSVVCVAQPRDEWEARLAVQLGAIQLATMMMARGRGSHEK